MTNSKDNRVPLSFHLLYLLLAGVLCYLYYLRVILPSDPDSPNSINSVLTFNTGKPYQYRLLIPFVFLIFKPLSFIPDKTLFLIFSTVIVYLIQLQYHKLLSGYFENNKRLLLFTPLILYTILFNYVILNQSFQYYDMTAILICIIGLYYIVTEKFTAFVLVFLIGLFNKESAAYLIFSYVLFNYREFFTFRVIGRTALLAAIIVAVKLSLGYIFRINPGDNFEIGYYENIRFAGSLFSEWKYFKPVFFNFGGIYIFAVLLFVLGWWKRFPRRRMLMANLTIVPFYVLGIFMTYIIEVRVYTELVPMITTVFLIYLSNFELSGLKPAKDNYIKGTG